MRTFSSPPKNGQIRNTPFLGTTNRTKLGQVAMKNHETVPSILQFAWLNEALTIAQNLQHLEKRRRNSYVLVFVSLLATCSIFESFPICFLPVASFCSLLSNAHFVSAGFLAAADGCFQHPIERRRNMADHSPDGFPAPGCCQSASLVQIHWSKILKDTRFTNRVKKGMQPTAFQSMFLAGFGL